MEEPSINEIESFDAINPPPQKQQEQKNQEEKIELEEVGKKKKCSYFPSAYTILICLEFIVFILTYIIPKGKFDTVEYDDSKNEFIISRYNTTSQAIETRKTANQTVLDELGVKIDVKKFTSGDIKKPISIPGTYKVLEEEENADFFTLFTYPIFGLIDASNVGFVLMMIGGCINILIEMNALTSGMEALGRITKHRRYFLLVLPGIPPHRLPGLVPGGRERGHQLFIVPGLHDEIKGAALHSFYSQGDIGVCGEQHHFHLRHHLLNLTGPVQALIASIDAGIEVHIQQHHVRPEALKRANKRHRRRQCLHLCKMHRQQDLQRLANAGIIIDNQYFAFL